MSYLEYVYVYVCMYLSSLFSGELAKMAQGILAEFAQTSEKILLTS